MKHNKHIIAAAIICVCCLLNQNGLKAQSYKIGDIYEFADGSKGVVCYVDPKDSKKGWVAALNDLGNKKYALWTGSRPTSLNSASYEDPNTIALSTWTNSGKNNTKLLVEAGNSPAANAIDYYNGWYIPDAVQLMRMYSLIPVLQDYFVAAGGNLALLGTAERNYWSSSRRGNNMVCLQNTNNWGGKYFEVSGTTEYYIRPVRDFGYEAHAYWLDNPKSASMTVNPEVTTTYDAVVVFGADTFPLTGTVAVHEKFDKDTLYETVCSSNLPYTSAVNPIFRNLDISRPHDYEPIRVTLQTIHGCDSIITLMLKVNESYIFTKNVANGKKNKKSTENTLKCGRRL